MVAAIVGMKMVSLAEKQDGGGGYKMSVNHHWHQHHRQKALCSRTQYKWVRPTKKLKSGCLTPEKPPLRTVLLCTSHLVRKVTTQQFFSAALLSCWLLTQIIQLGR